MNICCCYVVSQYKIESISSMKTNLWGVKEDLQSILMSLDAHHMSYSLNRLLVSSAGKLMSLTILAIEIINGFKVHPVKMENSLVLVLQRGDELVGNSWLACARGTADVKETWSVTRVGDEAIYGWNLIISALNLTFDLLLWIQIQNERVEYLVGECCQIAFFLLFFLELVVQINRGLELQLLGDWSQLSELAGASRVKDWSTLRGLVLSCALPRYSHFVVYKGMVEGPLESKLLNNCFLPHVVRQKGIKEVVLSRNFNARCICSSERTLSIRFNSGWASPELINIW